MATSKSHNENNKNKMKKYNRLPLPLVIGATAGTLLALVFLNLTNLQSSNTTVILADEASVSSEDPNATSSLNDYKNNYQNRTNELKNNFRSVDIDLTKLNTLMNEWNTILTQMESSVNIKDFATFWTLNSDENYKRQEVDDAFQEAYSRSNLASFQNQIQKDKPRELKDLENQLKNIKRDSKKSPVDTTALDTYISQLQTLLSEMQSLAGGASSLTDGDAIQDLADQIQDKIDEFNYLGSDFRDAINELWDVVNSGNRVHDAERNLKDKARTIKDLERELKRHSKDIGAEQVSEFQASIQKQKDIYAQIETAIANKDVDTLEYIDQDFWDANTESWDINNVLNEVGNQENNKKDATRWLKDISREIKDKGRMVADLERETKHKNSNISAEEVTALQAIYDQMVDAAGRAKTALDSGDGEGAREILDYEFNDLRMQFDDYSNSFSQKKEEGFIEFELENIGKEIEEGRHALEKALEHGEIDEAKSEICSGYLAEAEEMYQNLKAIVESGDIGGQEELMIRFENLGNEVDRECGDIFGEDEEYHESYVDYYVEEDLQGLADQIFAKISEELLSKMMSNYQSTINAMLEEAGQKWQGQLQNFLESSMAVYDITSKENIETLLNQKARLLEQIDELESKISVKNAEFQALQNRLAGYNFYGQASEEIQSELEDFVAQSTSLSEPQQQQKIKELQAKADQAVTNSREEKYKDGVIPFKDTDDNEWYTQYVASLFERGIVSGYKDSNGNLTGQFGPGDSVLVSQVLKIALEASGDGESEGEPNLDQAKNHWSKGYVKQAENIGLSIVKGLDNLDRPATRAEVVRIILEIAGVDPQDVEQSSFTDVSSSNPNIDYIEEAKNLGIISGDSGQNTFRPNDGINRGEVTKITFKFLNQFFTEEESETEYVPEI